MDAAVKQLLTLKAEYKQQTGQEYKPGAQPVQPTPAKTESSSSPKAPELFSQVAQQGELVRKLKSEKAPKVRAQQMKCKEIQSDTNTPTNLSTFPF